ncbi:MAG: hypothetical protein AAF828_07755 [Bacteroidota bacterium]
MKSNVPAFLLNVLYVLTGLFVAGAVGLLVFGTVGDQLAWPEPLPQVESARRTAQVQEQYDLAAADGLHIGPGYQLVKQHCTICHSAKLITQNRATREGWATMIDWMQAKQGLWDLGKNEPAILTYLSTYYGVEEDGGRRANLAEVEWYVLEL